MKKVVGLEKDWIGPSICVTYEIRRVNVNEQAMVFWALQYG
jgi:hypothetical protein